MAKKGETKKETKSVQFEKSQSREKGKVPGRDQSSSKGPKKPRQTRSRSWSTEPEEDPEESKRSQRKKKKGEKKESRGDEWEREDRTAKFFRSTRRVVQKDSSYTRPRRPRKEWIIPDKFDGTQSWNSFQSKFMNCVDYNDWEEKDAVAHLRQSLVGQAGLVLWTDGGQKATFRKLMAKLEKQYGSKAQTSMYRVELETRRRKRGETLTSLRQDISRLMFMAYPGPWSDQLEGIAVDAFVKALSDYPEIHGKVRDLEPKNLEEAVRHAKRFEAYACADQNDRMSRDDGKIRERHELRSVTQSLAYEYEDLDKNGQEEESSKKSLALELEMQKLMKENNALKEKNLQLENSQQGGYQNGNNQNMRGPPREYQGQGAGGGYRPRQPFLCFRCGGEGHMARNCDAAAPAQQGQASPAAGQTVPGLTPGASYRVGTIHCEEIDSESDQEESLFYGMQCCAVKEMTVSPVTKFCLMMKIKGKDVKAMLDSGSQKTLVNAGLVGALEMSNCKKRLKAANGSDIGVLGRVDLPLTLVGRDMGIEALVVEEMPGVVLGLDWLTKYKVQWLFNGGFVVVRGRKYPLLSEAVEGAEEEEQIEELGQRKHGRRQRGRNGKKRQAKKDEEAETANPGTLRTVVEGTKVRQERRS